MTDPKVFLHGIPGIGKSELAKMYAKRHNRFLRSLREDTLLIVDNLNMSRDQDGLLDVMLIYSCRILFTTRSRYENQISLEVREFPVAMLLVLIGKFYDAGKKTGLLEEMIGLLHGHTYAVEQKRQERESMAMPALQNLRKMPAG